MEPRIPWGRNALTLLPLTTLLYVGYQLSNRIHLVEPFPLSLTAIDRAIPFLLWTVWPYFLLVLGLFLPLGIRDRALFRRAMIAFTIAVCLNIAIWMLAPTIYARPPLPENHGLTEFAYRWLCSIDTPANCFPSGHITSPTIGCWALANALALLAPTILTTKQHYLVDLFGGLATATLGILISGKFIARNLAKASLRE
jgi:hypothetical protein